MPSVALICALVVFAGIGVASLVRPAEFRKQAHWVVAACGLPTGYAFGVVFTRTVLHQDWRLFQNDLLFFSIFVALLLTWFNRRGAAAIDRTMPAPAAANAASVSAAPAGIAPAVPVFESVPPSELREKLRVRDEERERKYQHLEAQRRWLEGVERDHEELMMRFQNARNDDERTTVLERLGKVTDDLEHARREVRATERSVDALDLELRAMRAVLDREERTA